MITSAEYTWDTFIADTAVYDTPLDADSEANSRRNFPELVSIMARLETEAREQGDEWPKTNAQRQAFVHSWLCLRGDAA